jgi:outer membrane protein
MSRRAPFRLAIFICLLAGLTYGAFAQTSPDSPFQAGRTVGLQDTMRWVLERNFALRVQAQDVGVARDSVDRARGEFDPKLFFSSNYEDNTRKLNAIDYSSFGLSTADPTETFFNEENVRTAAGLSGKLPTGTQYEVSLTMNRLDNDVNRAGRFFSPEFESFAGLTVTQPLLKDFWLKANMAETRMARLEVRISERAREVEVVNKLIELANAYYDMVFGLENLKVKQEAVTIARKLREENAERVRLGKMTDIDLTQADVKISEAREEQILGEDFLRERRVKLLKLLADDFAAGPIPEFNVNADLGVGAVDTSPADLVAAALGQRPDYLLAQDQIDKGRFSADRARNQRLPQVDLRFSYGHGGLDNDFGGSFNQVTGDNQHRMSAGVIASLPIGNRKAAADLRTARRRVQQAELSVAELKTTISIEVSNALQRLQTLRLRLDTALQSRKFAEAGWNVEQARLEAGKTTSFSVLDFQRKVSDARTREIAARVDLKKAEAELWGATGLFMQKHGFSTADAAVAPERSGPAGNTPSLSTPSS